VKIIISSTGTGVTDCHILQRNSAVIGGADAINASTLFVCTVDYAR
jgi:hypothetical protein